MRTAVPERILRREMYARAVEEAGTRLRELRREERENLGLGAVALALALAATQMHPPLAMPLFLGGLAVGASGVRAVWRRWDLVDRLAAERDAFAIPEVLAYASRETTTERRADFAATIRGWVDTQEAPTDPRCRALFAELDELARELDDPGLELDPACAVDCMRLLGVESALFDRSSSSIELRAQVRRVRSGFRAAAGA